MTDGLMSKGRGKVAAGVLFMSAAMLLIPLVDGQAKYLTTHYSPLFIAWSRYVVSLVFILPVAFLMKGKAILPTSGLFAHSMRALCLVPSLSFFFLAVSTIPLADATAAYLIAPLVATALAVPVLGEKLTGTKIIALALGAVGALVVLRPSGGIQPGLFLALGAGFFFALYMLATRAASQDSDPIQTLVFQCFAGIVLMLPQAIWTWSMIADEHMLYFFGIGLISSVSYFLSIAAFRYAEASVLSPIVYLELVSAAVIGYFLFDDVPELAVIIGSVFIVAAGLVLIFGKQSAKE